MVVMGIAGGASCTTSPPRGPSFEKERFLYRVVHRLQDLHSGWSIPEVTPFDGDADQRAEYLDFYARGYRAALIGIKESFCGPPYCHARWQGWCDGQSAGFSVFMDACLELLNDDPVAGSR